MTKKRNEIDDPIGVLSLRLNAAFQRRNGADWLDVRRRARRQRAPLSWSRRRVLVLAGTLVLGVVACAGSTGVIPWLNHHPLKIQAPLLAPPCRVSDLRVSLGYSVNLRSTDGGFKLENRGRRACSLAGGAGRSSGEWIASARHLRAAPEIAARRAGLLASEPAAGGPTREGRRRQLHVE